MTPPIASPRSPTRTAAFSQYSYNAAGQRSSMKDQTGFTVNYSYNSLGQLSKLTDGNGNLIVSYTYDAVGRLSSEQFGNGTATDYTYDADSDVTSIVNLAPGGAVQSSYVYTYNSTGLPVYDDDRGRHVHIRLRWRRPAHLGSDARRRNDHLPVRCRRQSNRRRRQRRDHPVHHE